MFSLVSGAVLAAEPWLVADTNLLHTDAQVTIYSAISLFSLFLALHGDERGRPGPARGPRLGWCVAAGVAAGLAVLTKANALGIVGPGVVCILVWGAWDSLSRSAPDSRPAIRRDLACALITFTSSGLVVVGVLWPALIVSPRRQVAAVLTDIAQAGAQQRVKYFHGAITTGRIPQFYEVALAFHLTPWCALLCVVGALGALGGAARTGVLWVRRRRHKGGSAAVLAVVPPWVVVALVPYTAVITGSRDLAPLYATPLIPFGVVAGALVMSEAWGRVPRLSRLGTRGLTAVGLVALLTASGATATLAPYAWDYADPLFGGQKSAARWLTMSDLETTAQLDERLSRVAEGHCQDMRVAVVAQPLSASMSCGVAYEATSTKDLTRADYAITDLLFLQLRWAPWFEAWLQAHATRVGVIRIDGVVFSELWQIRKSPQ